MNQYQFKKKLGSGSFGTTYLAIDKHNERYVTIKAIPLTKNNDDMIIKRQKILDEVSVLQTLSLYPDCNKHIVCYYDTFIGELGARIPHMFIVMEYIEGSTLGDYLRSRNHNLPLKKKWDILLQLIEGLAYIHSRKIAHRDIKPENIMITPTGRIKYIDFGLSCVSECIEEGCLNICNKDTAGTLPFIPPEYFNRYTFDNYTELEIAQMGDIWSLGVILYMINNNGKYPFPYSSIGSIEYIAQAPTVDPPSSNDILGNIIWNYMLRNNPIERTVASDLVNIIHQSYKSLDQTGPYTIIKELGRGGFGTTFLASSNDNQGKLVVLKAVKSSGNKQSIIDEVTILQTLSAVCDPYIVCYYDNFPGILDGEDVIFIVTEYIEGTTLKNYIITHPYIEETLLLSLFYNLAKGLLQIHDKGIAHRDIKPDNIMITPNGQIKYIDFGISCVLYCINPGCGNICKLEKRGTVGYMPPEVYEQFPLKFYNKLEVAQMGDIWSLGIVFFELANRALPNYNEEIVSTYPDDDRINILITEILKRNPAERMSINDIYYVLSELIRN